VRVVKPAAPKGERVWVAVAPDGSPLGNSIRRGKINCIRALQESFPQSTQQNRGWWREQGITIRRATLTLDPVKPKRRQP
jgi:hypothetical protein